MSKFNDLINGSVPVLIDFYADWCAPCHSMSPVVKEINNDFGDNLKVIKIDIEKNPLVAEKFSVKGVPTFIVYKKGELVWRQAGIIEKSDFSIQLNSIIN